MIVIIIVSRLSGHLAKQFSFILSLMTMRRLLGGVHLLSKWQVTVVLCYKVRIPRNIFWNKKLSILDLNQCSKSPCYTNMLVGGLNSELFFSYNGLPTHKATEPNLPLYLLISGGRRDGFMLFLRASVQSEMQTAVFKLNSWIYFQWQ